MHVICTLYALCTHFVQNFDFSGGTHRRQPMMTHEKSKSCGATAEHFQFFRQSIRRQSVIGRQSSVGKTSRQKGKTKQKVQTVTAPARGWVGKQDSGCHWESAAAIGRPRRPLAAAPTFGCRCLLGNKNFRFSLPYYLGY